MKNNSGLITSGSVHAENAQDGISENGFADIVPVISGKIGGCESNIVSAKALHKALGVGRDFSTWITERIQEYSFIRGEDYFADDDHAASRLVNEQYSPKRGNIRKRGRPEKDYYPSLSMAKELAMVERTEQGRAIRRYFIQCEEALQRSAPEIAAQYRRQLKARIGAANNFKPMCAALELARAEQGKETLSHHYSTESNMIARIVLGGLTAKKWAQANDITGEPRDGMNAEQLEHFSYLESTNITLIEMGQDYQQRKAELTRLSQRWIAKRVGGIHD